MDAINVRAFVFGYGFVVLLDLGSGLPNSGIEQLAVIPLLALMAGFVFSRVRARRRGLAYVSVLRGSHQVPVMDWFTAATLCLPVILAGLAVVLALLAPRIDLTLVALGLAGVFSGASANYVRTNLAGHWS